MSIVPPPVLEKVRAAHYLRRRREKKMLVRWFLFETRIGEFLLTILKRKLGLAVVQAEWLAQHPGGTPRVVSGE
jgi:hypothetical protein